MRRTNDADQQGFPFMAKRNEEDPSGQMTFHRTLNVQPMPIIRKIGREKRPYRNKIWLEK